MACEVIAEQSNTNRTAAVAACFAHRHLWALAAVLLLALISGVVCAEEPAEIWSPPQYVGTGELPAMAVDSEGVLHLIWSDYLSGDRELYIGDTLMYSWLQDDEWTNPVDVLAAPVGSRAVWPDLVFGQDGRLHAFWVSENRVWHASALPSGAGTARGWRTEMSLSYLHPNATSHWPYDVVVDGNGMFHCVFVDVGGDIWSFKYSRSNDDGHSWSEEALAVSATLGCACTLPRLAVSESGALYMTWSEFTLPEGWPPIGVFYSESDDGGVSWLAPLRLSEPNESYSNLVLAGDDEVHVVWNATNPPGRFHRRLRDGRQQWSETVRVSPAGGMTQGWPAIATDSAGTVHFVGFGSGEGGSNERYHLWNGTAWSQEFLVSPGESGRWTGWPSMLSLNGNEIHVAWSTWDPSEFSSEENRPGVWYRHLVTSAPRIDGMGVPKTPALSSVPGRSGVVHDDQMASPVPATTSPVVAQATEEEGRYDSEQKYDAPRTMGGSTQDAIVLGVVPVAALILVIVLSKSMRVRR